MNFSYFWEFPAAFWGKTSGKFLNQSEFRPQNIWKAAETAAKIVIILKIGTLGQTEDRDTGPGGGKAQVEVSGRYVRCWQGKGRSDWNVVVEVTPSQREAFFRAAAFLRQQVGVVVGPCLTALGCALRKERQTVFNSLLQQGLKPRWRKGVEIEFFSAGGWIQHDFEYFGG